MTLSSSLTVECLKSDSSLNQLQGVWQTLEKMDPACTFFDRWLWVNHCWQRRADENVKPRIVIVQKGKEVVAIAPLCLSQQQLMPRVSVSVLSFMGQVDALPLLRNGVIAQPRYRRAAEELIATHMMGMRGWEQLALKHLRADAPFAATLERIHQLSRGRKKTPVLQRQTSLVMESIPNDWLDFRNKSGSDRAGTLQRIHKFITERGKGEIQITSSLETFHTYAGWALDQHPAADIGHSHQKDVGEFELLTPKLLEELFRADSLWQITLTVGNETMAVQHYLLWHGSLVLVQSSATADARSVSIESFLAAYAIKRGIAHSFRSFCALVETSEAFEPMRFQSTSVCELFTKPAGIKRLLKPLLNR